MLLKSPVLSSYEKKNQTFKDGLKFLEDSLQQPTMREDYLKTMKQSNSQLKKSFYRMMS